MREDYEADRKQQGCSNEEAVASHVSVRTLRL
jgi:hypothetical protein